MKDLEIVAFAEKEFKTPFKWGVNDCNTLILKYLDIVHGPDVLKIALEQYSSRREAIKFQREYGQTLSELCISLGYTKIPPTRARMGDILIIKKKQFEIGHLCLGIKILSVVEDVITDMAFIPSFHEFDWGLRIN